MNLQMMHDLKIQVFNQQLKKKRRLNKTLVSRNKNR